MATIPTLDSSVLVNYFNAKLPVPSGAGTATAKSSTAASNDSVPWEAAAAPPQEVEDAAVLSTTSFLDLSGVPRDEGSTTASRTEQDNQKLFALYKAVNTLSYLAGMAKRDGMPAGQLQGLDIRFQNGLAQIQAFLKSATFNNFALQSGQAAASVTSTVSIPFAALSYSGGTVVRDADLAHVLPGISVDDSFDISVTKGGVTTDVPIAFSGVKGPLTLDNIVTYVNQQLSAAGFSTRFSRAMTQGSIDDPTNASYGIAINPAPSERVSLSSAAAAPALYVAGSTGTAGGQAPDQQGRLMKIAGLDASPQTVFNATANPDTGTSSAQAAAVDANGNVYVVGNASGNFGDELNQGSQDVYLSKYDSAGNLQWTKLLGSAGTAAAYSVALNPSGGVVVAGSTTANLTSDTISDGNTGSFAASFDSDGNQVWAKQIPTLNQNAAASVSVDNAGNVYLGGRVTGVIGSGQTNSGQADAYLAKLDSKGNIVYEQQFGTAQNDQAAATAVASDGSLIVASVQNGHAIVSKYADGDARSAPVWSEDLGDLQSGTIGGLVVSGNAIYLSGTTKNPALDANGQAAIANPSSGATDAFVFSLTDNGTSVSAGQVAYVGTSAADKAGSLTAGPDGTVYLAGSTTGTFTGQSRTAAGTSNMFVAALKNGTLSWVRQYGGADGQSAGMAVAIDPEGASVLDKLGLPRGAIGLNQPVDLAAQTTLRAGDSFSIQIQGAAPRTAKITIDKGETLASLANKIDAALLFSGKAKATYANGGKSLQITVNPGSSIALVSGPAGTDALGRLGIAPGTLSSPSKGSSNQTGSASASSSIEQVFGLGFNGPMDIATAAGAGAAKAQLLNVLSAIRDAYRKTNTPASPSSAVPSAGSAPNYLTAKLANYTVALSMLSGSTSSIA